MDGVIEAPERWANFDDEDAELSTEQLSNYDAFVMGRVTYEKLFAFWGLVAGNPYIDLINAMPKYVASRTLTETAWNATLLGSDPSGAIARLKAQPGKDLIKYGTSRFDDTLVRVLWRSIEYCSPESKISDTPVASRSYAATTSTTRQS